MRQLILAEWRKIFTIRSTYFVFLLTFIILMLFVFYGEGVQASHIDINPNKLSDILTNTVYITSAISGIVPLLLITHEYRFNTIYYSLIAAKKRSDILYAKVMATTLFSVFFTLTSMILALLLVRLGLMVNGIDMAPQTISYFDVLWRVTLYAVCHSMYAMIIASLIRNQTGSVMFYVLFPGIVELLLSLLLDKNSIFLPFTLLASIINDPGSVEALEESIRISHPQAALLTLAYVLIGWGIAFWQFNKLDAN